MLVELLLLILDASQQTPISRRISAVTVRGPERLRSRVPLVSLSSAENVLDQRARIHVAHGLLLRHERCSTTSPCIRTGDSAGL
jgi:hypothetical protein